MRLKFWLFLFLFLTSASLRATDNKSISLCAMLIENGAIGVNALPLPTLPINPEASPLEKRLLSPYAAIGFRRVIALDHGRKIFQLLERLGLLSSDQRAEIYLLSTQELPLNLSEKHPDAGVSRFLKRHQRRAKQGEINSLVLPGSWEARHDLIYSLALEALAPIDSVQSVNALETTFTEIQRLFVAMKQEKRITEFDMLRQIDSLLASLQSAALYHPTALEGLPRILRVPLEEIPFVPIVFTAIATAYQWVFEHDLTSKVQRFTPNKAPAGWVQTPGSLGLYLEDRDPMGLGNAVNEFFSRVLQKKEVPVFSPEFRAMLEIAWPSLRLVMDDGITNRFATGATEVVRGPFGLVSYEGHKALSRAGLLSSLIRGEYEPFRLASDPPSVEALSSYRAQFITDLSLSKDPQADADHLDKSMLDAFYVFVMLDSLGRGSDAFLKTLDERFKIRERMGTDYERILVEILKHYPHADHSFQRLSPESQELVRRCFGLVYHYNAGQVIQLESGKNAFHKLEEMRATPLELAFIYHRSFLSFLSLPETNVLPREGTTRLTQFDFERWMELREALLALDYDRYLDWYARRVAGLPKSPSKWDEIAALRLMAQSRGQGLEDYERVLGVYSSIDMENRETLERFLTDYPVLPYFSADLYQAIHDETSKDTREDELAKWMKLLARVFRRVERNSNFEAYLRQVRSAGEVRINLYAVLKYALANNTDNLAKLAIFAETNQGAFEIQIRDEKGKKDEN